MLQRFDQSTTDNLVSMLQHQHVRLGQIGQDKRTITARNYDSAIRALGDYLQQQDKPLPTRSVLEDWREAMLQDGKAVSTVNARLAAARKLLRAVAADVTDIQVKLVLESWAGVSDAKATIQQDKTEEDYGLRLTLNELQALLDSIDISTLKGLRDRALIALLAGAGLRVSEAVKLNLRDVFLTENPQGQRGIRIRDGKHHKSRVVVLNGWNSWILACIQAYTDVLDLLPMALPDQPVLYGVQRVKGGGYSSTGKRLSVRSAQESVEGLDAQHDGQPVKVAAHDLRRTYAKLCRDAGMDWDALRENLGHADLVTTQRYVGFAVDWDKRIPNWSVKVKDRN